MESVTKKIPKQEYKLLIFKKLIINKSIMKTYKSFQLSFEWNTIKQGVFPQSQLMEVDENMSIDIIYSSTFVNKITISTLIDSDDNELEVAFELGCLVESFVTQNLLKR